jgi:hypothetical protein
MRILACLFATASVLAFTPACSKSSRAQGCPQCGADIIEMRRTSHDQGGYVTSCECENEHKWFQFTSFCFILLDHLQLCHELITASFDLGFHLSCGQSFKHTRHIRLHSYDDTVLVDWGLPKSWEKLKINPDNPDIIQVVNDRGLKFTYKRLKW